MAGVYVSLAHQSQWILMSSLSLGDKVFYRKRKGPNVNLFLCGKDISKDQNKIFQLHTWLGVSVPEVITEVSLFQ